MSRFDYIEWDNYSEETCETLKRRFVYLEGAIEEHLQPSRERALVLTALEECFMWVGKAIRHDQIKRQGE